MKKGKILVLLCSLFLIFPFVISSCGGGGGDSAPVAPAAPADPAAPPAPDLSLSQSVYDFGDVTIGNMAKLTVNIKNAGTADLTINNVSLTGTAFILVSNNCTETPYTIPADGSCTLELTFAPTSVNEGEI